MHHSFNNEFDPYQLSVVFHIETSDLIYTAM